MTPADTTTPCAGCPFRGPMAAADVAAAREPGDSCVMLCHESGSLDGDGPDVACRGFMGQLAKRPEARP